MAVLKPDPMFRSPANPQARPQGEAHLPEIASRGRRAVPKCSRRLNGGFDRNSISPARRRDQMRFGRPCRLRRQYWMHCRLIWKKYSCRPFEFRVEGAGAVELLLNELWNWLRRFPN